MLLNQDRANEIMDREELDGLVAVNPLNQYYLSGHWGLFNTPDGYEATITTFLDSLGV